MVQPLLKHYPADRSRLTQILNDILEVGRKTGLTEKAMNRLRLISEELITNIIDYGYEKDDGEIQVKLDPSKNSSLTITIISGGNLFNPLEVPEPDTSRPLNEREPGGLGIFLSVTLSDHITYHTADGKNVLTFTVAGRKDEK